MPNTLSLFFIKTNAEGQTLELPVLVVNSSVFAVDAGGSLVMKPFSDFITTASLATTLGDYVTNASISSTLSAYVTNSTLSSLLGTFATSAEVAVAISALPVPTAVVQVDNPDNTSTSGIKAGDLVLLGSSSIAQNAGASCVLAIASGNNPAAADLLSVSLIRDYPRNTGGRLFSELFYSAGGVLVVPLASSGFTGCVVASVRVSINAIVGGAVNHYWWVYEAGLNFTAGTSTIRLVATSEDATPVGNTQDLNYLSYVDGDLKFNVSDTGGFFDLTQISPTDWRATMHADLAVNGEF